MVPRPNFHRRCCYCCSCCPRSLLLLLLRFPRSQHWDGHSWPRGLPLTPSLRNICRRHQHPPSCNDDGDDEEEVGEDADCGQGWRRSGGGWGDTGEEEEEEVRLAPSEVPPPPRAFELSRLSLTLRCRWSRWGTQEDPPPTRPQSFPKAGTKASHRRVEGANKHHWKDYPQG